MYLVNFRVLYKIPIIAHVFAANFERNLRIVGIYCYNWCILNSQQAGYIYFLAIHWYKLDYVLIGVTAVPAD